MTGHLLTTHADTITAAIGELTDDHLRVLIAELLEDIAADIVAPGGRLVLALAVDEATRRSPRVARALDAWEWNADDRASAAEVTLAAFALGRGD